ncbi:hypothetical protein G7046_g9018 [Stylonectria norvegica]|nr:hypothetical protein G7046_g9018 [Stylonectria norvegica]
MRPSSPMPNYYYYWNAVSNAHEMWTTARACNTASAAVQTQPTHPSAAASQNHVQASSCGKRLAAPSVQRQDQRPSKDRVLLCMNIIGESFRPGALGRSRDTCRRRLQVATSSASSPGQQRGDQEQDEDPGPGRQHREQTPSLRHPTPANLHVVASLGSASPRLATSQGKSHSIGNTQSFRLPDHWPSAAAPTSSSSNNCHGREKGQKVALRRANLRAMSLTTTTAGHPHGQPWNLLLSAVCTLQPPIHRFLSTTTLLFSLNNVFFDFQFQTIDSSVYFGTFVYYLLLLVVPSFSSQPLRTTTTHLTSHYCTTPAAIKRRGGPTLNQSLSLFLDIIIRLPPPALACRELYIISVFSSIFCAVLSWTSPSSFKKKIGTATLTSHLTFSTSSSCLRILSCVLLRRLLPWLLLLEKVKTVPVAYRVLPQFSLSTVVLENSKAHPQAWEPSQPPLALLQCSTTSPSSIPAVAALSTKPHGLLSLQKPSKATPSPLNFDTSLPNRLPTADAGASATNPFTPDAPLQLSGLAPLPFIGHHFFNSAGVPTFVLDGGSITLFGKKLDSLAAPATADKGPDGTGAVAWLRLGDNGGSTGATFVFRVLTSGGASHGCTAVGDDTTSYSATYWFYG